ncbi:unnamed protein product [Rhodiola kirilowii]
MNREWVSGNRLSDEYEKGIMDFCAFASAYASRNNIERVFCPCMSCWNYKLVKPKKLRKHLLFKGINPQYTVWYLHGEGEQQNFEPPPVESLPEDNDDWEEDNLIEMVNNVANDFVDTPHILESLRNDSELPLYEECSKYTRLSAMLKLFNLKAKNGWSNKSFTELLALVKDMLPEGNSLPNRTYEAKKVMCPMGLEYKKIHACPNDCILYRNAYSDLKECPVCKASRYKLNKEPKGKSKGTPSKVLWYLPPIPRFQRLFADTEDSNNMRWHAEKRVVDTKMRHPADSLQWAKVDNTFPVFGTESRNLRLGLSTDGVNPHGNLSSQHSTWPVILVIYNLPPKLTMKRRYMMLSLLISGPRQPGNDIDVYLAPLIDDLKLLWDEGVCTYDASRQEHFNMRAMLMCTINDFPAYGNLSGYTIKGYKACPVCGEGTHARHLSNCRKMVYMGHRRFLPRHHPYRQKKVAFNGETEHGIEPLPASGDEILQKIQNITNRFGKPYSRTESAPWKKRSIFFDLPYWHSLDIRHCIDVMHVEKNICESLLGTLLNIPGKTKDGIKARLDMLEMNIRTKLAPESRGQRTYLPPSCTTLSRSEKTSLCGCLKGVKVPYGFSSNIASLVSMKDLRLNGLKSHDCHTLMQQLLPIAIRGIMSPKVRTAIQRLCVIFSSLCPKVIDTSELDGLQEQIVVTLCQLEMFFPPSFFDIMVHLTVHLVREVRILGPVHMRWMYPFERYMKVLKSYVRNRQSPEGCIVQGYIAEEAVEFCTNFLGNTSAVGVPRPRHFDRFLGKGTSGHQMMPKSFDELTKAHFYVLQHIPEISPFIEDHMNILRSTYRGKSEQWLQKEHSRSFCEWLRSNEVLNNQTNSEEESDDVVKWLMASPRTIVQMWKAYDINGFCFQTKDQDEHTVVQNSGVTLVAETTHVSSARDRNPISVPVNYFGIIQEIWELDYVNFRVPVFKCKWVNNSAVHIDEFGMTFVDFRREGSKDEPFIMAEQARQVFYIKDPSNNNHYVVINGKQQLISGTSEEMNVDCLLVCTTVPVHNDDSEVDDEIQLREDHGEGIWIDKET